LVLNSHRTSVAFVDFDREIMEIITKCLGGIAVVRIPCGRRCEYSVAVKAIESWQKTTAAKPQAANVRISQVALRGRTSTDLTSV